MRQCPKIGTPNFITDWARRVQSACWGIYQGTVDITPARVTRLGWMIRLSIDLVAWWRYSTAFLIINLLLLLRLR